MIDEKKVVAIVGNCISYKDNDAFANLLTRGDGNILATAKSVKKADAKLKYAVSVFNIGRYILCGKMNVIKECVQIESLSDITLDINRYFIGCYILKNFAKINDKSTDPALFDKTVDILTRLTYGEIEPLAAQIEFLSGMLKLNGFNTEFMTCSVCGKPFECAAFDVEAGVVCRPCSAPSQSIYISREAIQCIHGKETSEKYMLETVLLLEEIIYHYMGIKIIKNKETELK